MLTSYLADPRRSEKGAEEIVAWALYQLAVCEEVGSAEEFD